jgi:hypothetical protein
VLGGVIALCHTAGMWRRMLGIEDQTRAEKRASINGMNLFFGALIGANLGTLERLAINDYTLLISIVALIVLYIQLAPIARRRWTYLGTLAVMVGALYFLLLTPHGQALFQDRPRPSPHLFVTICLWLGTVAWIEVRPLAKVPEAGA